jgi:glycerate kinase
MDERLAQAQITVICDVDNRCAVQRSICIYGPQKGATRAYCSVGCKLLGRRADTNAVAQDFANVRARARQVDWAWA